MRLGILGALLLACSSTDYYAVTIVDPTTLAPLTDVQE